MFQDESLTSVIAEQRLVATKKPYSKGDIDATAAALILQDYLEAN
jgi:putative holliday junction resolvase